jgi:LysM domain-containing protein
MKITHIATAAAVPAVIAGAAISFGIAGHAAGGQAHRTANRAPGSSAPAGDIAARSGAARSGGARSGPEQASTASSAARQERPAIWVTVRRGQTLGGIAAAHHMTWQAIYATPPNVAVLDNPDRLVAGERLRIPSDPKLRQAQFTARYAAKLASRAASSPATAAAPSGRDAVRETASTAGESAFEQCVAWRESSDTPTDPDGLFGILPSTWQSLGYSGTAGEASVAVQKQAFARLYAEDGTAPWAPYDGC